MEDKYVIGYCNGCGTRAIKVKLYQAAQPNLGDKEVHLCDWCTQTLLGNCAIHPERELTNNDLAQIVFFAARRVIEAIGEKDK